MIGGDCKGVTSSFRILIEIIEQKLQSGTFEKVALLIQGFHLVLPIVELWSGKFGKAESVDEKILESKLHSSMAVGLGRLSTHDLKAACQYDFWAFSWAAKNIKDI